MRRKQRREELARQLRVASQGKSLRQLERMARKPRSRSRTARPNARVPMIQETPVQLTTATAAQAPTEKGMAGIPKALGASFESLRKAAFRAARSEVKRKAGKHPGAPANLLLEDFGVLTEFADDVFVEVLARLASLPDVAAYYRNSIDVQGRVRKDSALAKVFTSAARAMAPNFLHAHGFVWTQKGAGEWRSTAAELEAGSPDVSAEQTLLETAAARDAWMSDLLPQAAENILRTGDAFTKRNVRALLLRAGIVATYDYSTRSWVFTELPMRSKEKRVRGKPEPEVSYFVPGATKTYIKKVLGFASLDEVEAGFREASKLMGQEAQRLMQEASVSMGEVLDQESDL